MLGLPKYSKGSKAQRFVICIPKLGIKLNNIFECY